MRGKGSRRFLTNGENRELQGIPPSYRIAGNDAERRRQIGNAVPPSFSEIIGLTILGHSDAPKPSGPEPGGPSDSDRGLQTLEGGKQFKVVITNPPFSSKTDKPTEIVPDSDTWLTPPKIIEALGTFDLDPCCPPSMPWRTASRMLTKDENGLKTPWQGRVWLNPPYSDVGPWLAKLAAHGDGIALVPSRTETKAFKQFVWGAASAVLFVNKRLQFHRADGTLSEHTADIASVLVLSQLCSFGKYAWD